jgi:uncharacterized protein (DUF983 family)
MNIATHYRLRIGTMLHRLCPECGRGRVFGSTWSMNERCPVCGLRFGRGEPGYFTGAMYFSYALAIPLIALLTLIEYLILPRWSLFRLVFLAWLICVPLIPWIWQYSRVIWIHFDQFFDPGDTDTPEEDNHPQMTQMDADEEWKNSDED